MEPATREVLYRTGPHGMGSPPGVQAWQPGPPGAWRVPVRAWIVWYAGGRAWLSTMPPLGSLTFTLFSRGAAMARRKRGEIPCEEAERSQPARLWLLVALGWHAASNG